MPSAFCLILFLCLSLSGFAQEISNHQVKRIPVTTDSLRIDTLSIIPGSVQVRYFEEALLPDSDYVLDYTNAMIRFRQTVDLPDSVIIEYRRYPLRFNKPYYHKDSSFAHIDPGPPKRFYSPDLPVSPFSVEGGRLKSSGSLSRGVSMGNNRDASLSSNLNLTLQGYLSRDFQIEATLSDANIPIQPDGTTQHLQEFDRIYLRIFNPQHQITAGDFEIQSNPSQFMKYFKKVQGLEYSNENRKSKIENRKNSVAVAVVKGKYSVNRIQGVEGNQGPYPLTGADGEQYFQVIAGSEKVYIDGSLLSRGEDADYVIDYNSAELRFTPKVLITKDKRITVEFEYSERSYTRFLLSSQNRWETQRSQSYLQVYSESDARNQPLLQELSGEDKTWLSTIGDNLSLARVSSVQPTQFDPDRVLYQRKDTIVNGEEFHNILLQTFDSDSLLYTASFTFVGQNKGDYQQVKSSANGRVFEWIAPKDGVPQGSYAPIVRLVTPESRQMLVAGTRYQLSGKMDLETEFAFSRFDPNTFSSLDKQDNMGLGITSRLNRIDTIGKTRSIALRSWIGQRLTTHHFKAIERFRSVEFERDWNLTQAQLANTENLLNSGFQLKGRDSLFIGYEVEMLNLQSTYQGWRHHSQGIIPIQNSELDWNGSLLSSADPIMETGFLRHSVNYMLPTGKITWIVSEEGELNRQLATGKDSLLGSSFGYQNWALQAGHKSGKEWPWMLKLIQRTDRIPVAGNFRPETSAWDIESWFRLKSVSGQQLRAGFHYRRLTDFIGDSSGTPENTLTARVEYGFQIWKRLIVSQTFMELGSGNERKLDYSYLEVAPGQGLYTWNDYNSNDIRELNEFEISHFRDQANWIRIVRPGTGFVPTLVNRFNQTLTIQPKKGFWALFSSQLAYRMDKKTGRNQFLSALDPVSWNPNDTSLVSLNAQIRHTLSFNRSNPLYGAELISLRTANKTVMVNGDDRRDAWSHSLNLRYLLADSWQIRMQLTTGSREFGSEFFPAKNYQITNQTGLLQVERQSGSNLRFRGDWELSSDHNLLGMENLLLNRLEASTGWSVPGKGLMEISLQYLWIRYAGATDSPVGYVMLKGFLPGHNGLMHCSLRYQIAKNLQMDIVYEMRLSTGRKAIHTGQIQVRALF